MPSFNCRHPPNTTPPPRRCPSTAHQRQQVSLSHISPRPRLPPTVVAFYLFLLPLLATLHHTPTAMAASSRDGNLVGPVGASAGKRLKVLTFNTWLGGASVEDGFAKIARHIKRIDPDIVGLQVSGDLGFHRLENEQEKNSGSPQRQVDVRPGQGPRPAVGGARTQR